MNSVTVSELNRQTAKVLERVKAGESVEISEYGRPVARHNPGHAYDRCPGTRPPHRARQSDPGIQPRADLAYSPAQ